MKATILLAAAATMLAAALAAQTPPIDLAYTHPGIQVPIAPGRTINLTCMGQGSPTVILSGGLGASSYTWRKVQPAIARETRVCGWDHAGFGFSSPSPLPQTISNTVADLEAALAKGEIKGPYIIVGHSYGGLESLMFADRNLPNIKAMVLVDPSVPDQVHLLAAASPNLAAMDAKDLADQVVETKQCAAEVRAGTLKPGGPDPRHCFNPNHYPPEIAAAQAALYRDPKRFDTMASLVAGFDAGSLTAINPKRDYRGLPLILLSATQVEEMPKDTPPALIAEGARAQTAFIAAHDELAKLSTRGRNDRVEDSAHNIQLIQPQRVIAAIEEVLRETR